VRANGYWNELNKEEIKMESNNEYLSNDNLKTTAEILRRISMMLAAEKDDKTQRAQTALVEAWAALLELAGEPLDPCGNENCKLHYPKSRCARAGDVYGATA
jgi:hypothetical protein